MEDKQLEHAMRDLIGATVVAYDPPHDGPDFDVEGQPNFNTGGELILKTVKGTLLRVFSTSYVEESIFTGTWSKDELVIQLVE